MMRRGAVRSIAIALGVLVGTTLVLTVRGHSSTGMREGRSIAGILDPNAPLGPNGAAVGLSKALVMSPVPVYRPQANLASDQTISNVWVRTVSTPEVFIRYDSGIEVAVRPADFTDGFENFFKSELAYGEPGTLTSVQGIPVFLCPGGKEGAVLAADMLINRMLVEIVAPASMTEDDVVQLVNLIIAEAPTIARPGS
jgi:hypothetical protein